MLNYLKRFGGKPMLLGNQLYNMKIKLQVISQHLNNLVVALRFLHASFFKNTSYYQFFLMLQYFSHSEKFPRRIR